MNIRIKQIRHHDSFMATQVLTEYSRTPFLSSPPGRRSQRDRILMLDSQSNTKNKWTSYTMSPNPAILGGHVRVVVVFLLLVIISNYYYFQMCSCHLTYLMVKVTFSVLVNHCSQEVFLNKRLLFTAHLMAVAASDSQTVGFSHVTCLIVELPFMSWLIWLCLYGLSVYISHFKMWTSSYLSLRSVHKHKHVIFETPRSVPTESFYLWSTFSELSSVQAALHHIQNTILATVSLQGIDGHAMWRHATQTG